MNWALKRLLTVFLALFLLGYVGYQAYQNLYSPIRTETATLYTVYETVETTGVAIRNETMLPQTGKGYTFFTAENGSRVPKNGIIAKTYSSQADAWTEQQLALIDAEMATLQSIQTDGTANRVHLELIDQRLSQTVSELITDRNRPSFSKLGDLHTELSTLMNKQQIITGKVTDFSERIAMLTAKRKEVAGSFTPSNGMVKSPVAGYFVSGVDGYETTWSVGDVTGFTTEKIKEALACKPTPPDQEYMGKVVGDYEWYLACTVPIAYMSLLTVDTALTLKLPFVSGDDIPVTVASCHPDKSGELGVVFRCTNMSEALSSIRMEPVQIQLVKHTGLRVPKEAIVTDETRGSGVYVRVGNIVSFRKVTQEFNDATAYSICKNIEENNYLRLYDDIILGGKGLYDGKIIR